MCWLVGLGVWFSLWVREVPGSNPGRAHQPLLSVMLSSNLHYIIASDARGLRFKSQTRTLMSFAVNSLIRHVGWPWRIGSRWIQWEITQAHWIKWTVYLAGPKIQTKVHNFEVRAQKMVCSWLVGLGVWFSLRVREVPGSNPGRAQRATFEALAVPCKGWNSRGLCS